jgi:hypothetical protein
VKILYSEKNNERVCCRNLHGIIWWLAAFLLVGYSSGGWLPFWWLAALLMVAYVSAEWLFFMIDFSSGSL